MERSHQIAASSIWLALLATGIAGAADTPRALQQLRNAPLVIPERLADEEARNRASLAQRGYVDKQSELSAADFALQRIAERERAAADAEARGTSPGDLRKRGIYRIGRDALPTMPFPLSAVPAGWVSPGSTAYLLPAGPRVTRVFPATKLGTLLIREHSPATLFADGQSAMRTEVAGAPAYITTIKYHGEKWATFVLVAKGKRVIEVEVGSRVDTPAKEAALQELMTSLITSP